MGAVSSFDTTHASAYPVWPPVLPRPLRGGYAFPVPYAGRAKRHFGGPPTPVDTRMSATSRPTEQVVNRVLYGADGNVLGMAQAGNTLYIAGAFRSIGENSGGLVPYDTRTGLALPSFPKVAGSVSAIVPDGTGGWYIGGEFTGVGGKPRSCLAQIGADGTLTDWNPSVSGSVAYIAPPSVAALAVRGNRVFVGGAFRFIGGQPRLDLGCVDARTGDVLAWGADASEDGFVSALALQNDTLFVGGGFSSLGGAPRSSLAAVNALTGEILPWRMDVLGGAYALLACSDTLFVGGDFIAIAGRSQPILVAADIPTATLLPIDFQAHGISQDYMPAPRVTGLARVSDTLYTVGNFDQIGGQARSGIAAVNAASGSALAWQPDTTGPRGEGHPPLMCLSVAVLGRAVYIGGYFGLVAGAHHPYIAGWDRRTGQVLDWTPTPDDAVLSFAASGDTLLVGGFFHMVGGWQHRAGLAAIDVATGRVKPWNPNPDGTVCTAVAVKGDRVLVSGDFSVVGGDPQPRSYFAALDTINGEVTAWDPGANDAATAFLLSGDTLFVGGMFTEIGGQARNGLAAIDMTTAMVLPWDPNATSNFDGYFPVCAVARSQDTIYLGGTFTEMGGHVRRGLAAVDANSGELSPWNPETDNSAVYALLISGSTLYVGGAFGVIGGQPQRALAALDLRTGQPTAWRPQLTEWDVVDPRVRALVLVDSVLCVGGSFASIGGQPRICLGGVDTTTGLATDWDPGTDGLVWTLAASCNTLYAGGGFSRAGGLPSSGLAAFAFPTTPRPPTASQLAIMVAPNPVRAEAVARFTLPAAGLVSLDVFDLQGRRVVSVVHSEAQSAGVHEVPIHSSGWREGMYFCRLSIGGAIATRKLAVLR